MFSSPVRRVAEKIGWEGMGEKEPKKCHCEDHLTDFLFPINEWPVEICEGMVTQSFTQGMYLICLWLLTAYDFLYEKKLFGEFS